MKQTSRLVLIAALLVSGCTATDSSPGTRETTPATGCGSAVETGSLPMWARAGFSDADEEDGARVPHVFGRQGDILGVLFGGKLSSPPAPDRSNKILWVSRLPVTPGGSLEITAKLDGTTDTVTQTIPGGPGPSGVDLPRPGCWHFTLARSGHTDAMDLTYEPVP